MKINHYTTKETHSTLNCDEPPTETIACVCAHDFTLIRPAMNQCKQDHLQPWTCLHSASGRVYKVSAHLPAKGTALIPPDRLQTPPALQLSTPPSLLSSSPSPPSHSSHLLPPSPSQEMKKEGRQTSARGPACSRGNEACEVQERMDGWTDGWMEGGREGGEGTAGGRGRKDEMKVERSVEGLITEEQASKNII